MNNPQTQKRRFAALHYRDFRLLWIGQLISVAGSQMQLVAINWHMYILTHSAIALGLIGFFRFVPLVLLSPIAGSISDSFNRKKINLIAQIFLTFLAIILAITTVMHIINPIIVYLITLLGAVGMAFDMPSRQALIPSTVEKKDIASAISLGVIMFEIATIAGPAFAGFAIARLGVGSVYGLNAISFLAVIAALLLMKTSGNVTGPVATVSFISIKEGFAFVKSKTIIWSTMILDFFSTFFSSATALLPIFAKDILLVGPQGLGFLYAAEAVGAAVVGMAMAHQHTIRKQGPLLLTGIVLYALGTIVFGFSKVFLLSLLALFLVGSGDGINTIIRNTIRQVETPDYIRGRMTAINMVFYMGGPQLGEFEAGALAALIGAPWSVVTGGIGTLVVVGIMAAVVPILRKYDTHQEVKN